MPDGNTTPITFNDPTASLFQPEMDHLDGSALVGLITFNQAGWTIAPGDGVGGTNKANVRIGTGGVTSLGAGVNTIDAELLIGNGAVTLVFETGAGNTLNITKYEMDDDPTIEKRGDGTLVFSNDSIKSWNTDNVVHTYAGTVLVNGASTSSTNTNDNTGKYDWTVEQTGRLGGVGMFRLSNTSADNSQPFGQRVIARNGGVLAPGGNGAFGDSIGTLTADAVEAGGVGVVIDEGGILEIEIDGDADLADLLQLTGGNGILLDLSAVDDRLNLVTTGSFAVGDTFTIATSTDISGTFGSVLENGAGTSNWVVDYMTPGQIDVRFVPEPASVALLSLGVVVVGARRRGRIAA